LNVVFIHRHPLEVTSSLSLRDGLSIPTGLLLWLGNVLNAEFSTRGQARFFTSYVKVLDNWQRAIADIEAFHSISLRIESSNRPKAVGSFLDSSLRNQNEDKLSYPESTALTDWANDVYDVLEKWATGGEDHADYNVLDHIRAKFNKVAPMIAPAKKHAAPTKTELADQKSAEQTIEELEILLSVETVERESRFSGDVVNRMLHDIEKRYESRIRAMEKENREKAQQIEDRFEELATLTRLMVGKEHELSELKDINVYLNASVDAILNSTSWRITTPIRRVMSGAKRILR